jgi:hypothetical protein
MHVKEVNVLEDNAVRYTNEGGAPMNAALLKPSSCLIVPLRRGQSLWVMIERLAPAHGWVVEKWMKKEMSR